MPPYRVKNKKPLRLHPVETPEGAGAFLAAFSRFHATAGQYIKNGLVCNLFFTILLLELQENKSPLLPRTPSHHCSFPASLSALMDS